MTREKLETLSMDALLEIAERAGLDVSREDGREMIVELVFDALEEDREERESDNNNPIRIEEKKYLITRDDEDSGDETENITLPLLYNETRIVLLLRDPSWAFAYWEFKEQEIKQLRQEQQLEELFLRVRELETGEDAAPRTIDQFDIPIQPSDTCWYINLPNQETSYGIDLCCRLKDGSRLLARSRMIRVPRGAVAGTGDGDDADQVLDAADMIIALSGLEKIGVSSFQRAVPQRVISPLDAQYMR